MAKIKFAVIGNPIEHSMSPEIHEYFASQNKLSNFSYKKILSTEADLENDISKFFSCGGRGLNVTIPFKLSAYKLCNQLDSTASRCGSVNTLVKDENKIIGHNTDGLGFIDDLRTKNISLVKSKILIIGAGGSAMSICSALLNSNQEVNISILNRTIVNAEKLISFFKDSKLEMYNKKDSYDLIINTTPISMSGEEIYLPMDILKNNPTCYDLFYSKETTSFQKWAYNHGVEKCFDGLGMLIHQAKHSFFIWNGITPDTNLLEDNLRFI